jgi:hypothetical protein
VFLLRRLEVDQGTGRRDPLRRRSFGLAFSGPDDGWFIGNITSDGRHILAEQWDGSTWSADSVADLGTLDAVAATPGGGYWAVGEYVSIRGLHLDAHASPSVMPIGRDEQRGSA